MLEFLKRIINEQRLFFVLFIWDFFMFIQCVFLRLNTFNTGKGNLFLARKAIVHVT